MSPLSSHTHALCVSRMKHNFAVSMPCTPGSSRLAPGVLSLGLLRWASCSSSGGHPDILKLLFMLRVSLHSYETTRGPRAGSPRPPGIAG